MPLKDYTKEKYDIIIQAGQSNSDGTAFGQIDAAYQPKYEVWHLTGDYVIEIARELVNGNNIQSHYGFAFADEYLKAGRLEEGRKLLIIRSSIGGTGFLDNHWKLTDDLYLRMLNMIDTALELNPENRLVAFLWHQGETDAILNATYDVHYKHLSDLVGSVREKYNVPALPFVAGDFVPHWRDDNAEICKPVIDAMRAFCSEPNNAFVESTGLVSNAQDEGNPCFGFDTIHFCRKSIYELGRRYYAAFAGTVK